MEVETTQEAFDEYIKELPDKQLCKYTEEFHGIVSLCNSHFICKYQAKVHFQFKLKSKNECNRTHYMKLKNML